MKLVLELNEQQLNQIVSQVADVVQEKNFPKKKSLITSDFYTVGEIAKMSKRTDETVRYHIQQGLLSAKKTGKRWMISEEAYQKYIEVTANPQTV